MNKFIVVLLFSTIDVIHMKMLITVFDEPNIIILLALWILPLYIRNRIYLRIVGMTNSGSSGKSVLLLPFSFVFSFWQLILIMFADFPMNHPAEYVMLVLLWAIFTYVHYCHIPKW